MTTAWKRLVKTTKNKTLIYKHISNN
jgi:hypothetical protein